MLDTAQVCAGGSCLGQLQDQLTVVFTAKLFGLQASPGAGLPLRAGVHPSALNTSYDRV